MEVSKAATKPKRLKRTEYQVAWIAPVSAVELLPSRLMLDEEHAVPPYDTSYDDNVYYCGQMVGHNVVIATCPAGLTGNVSAGRLAGPMFKTFPNIRMAVLVGIGGGVPRRDPSDDPAHDVHLGDVVVGWPGDGKPACVYYDSGRAHASGRYEMLGAIDRPDRVLLNALGRLTSDHEMGASTFREHYEILRGSKHGQKFVYPGHDQDRLFRSAYRHPGPHGSTCAECDPAELVKRPPRTEKDTAKFIFHAGRIATGNSVVRDGERRDQIREQCDGALCIEMEAAGVDASIRCLVIRGISDYADSHKNDFWQSYAAGNAAVFARELLSKVPHGIITGMEKFGDTKGTLASHFIVPFGRNDGFVGREAFLLQLLDKIPPLANDDDCQRTAIEGLGGVGKTQIAIEAAYRVHKKYPDCSIFWVPTINMITFENAYREIGRALNTPGIEEERANVKTLVKTALEKHAGSWLLIVDNADDPDLLFGAADGPPIRDYLPFNRRGSILFTTRTHEVAVRFDIQVRNIFAIGELTVAEGTEMLQSVLKASQMEDVESTRRLLDMLARLPLAIKQASAHMARTGISTTRYLTYCHSSDKAQIKLLSQDFEDRNRYRDIANPVATTWLISFNHIARRYPLAAQYLKFICFLAEKDIPTSLLPPGKAGEDELEQDEAVSALKGYAFITERGQSDSDSFDIHRLVRLAMCNYLQGEERTRTITNVVHHLSNMYPFPTHAQRNVWMRYMPHAQTALKVREESTEATCFLLDKVGWSYNIMAKYEQAEQSYRQSLQISEKLLGQTHRDTLVGINNLGIILKNQAKYSEAEQMHRHTFELREEELGRDHPDTLASMNNLAEVLRHQGKYAEAEKMHRQALEIKEGMPGRKNPDILQSMNGVGIMFQLQGKYHEAEEMNLRTLELSTEMLGREHPDTLNSMNNLGVVFDLQGKSNEAEQIHRQTLQLREEVLGREHPNTLYSMINLAEVFRHQEKYSEARQLYQQALELQVEVLGRKHPDALSSMNNLALVLQHEEKYDEAEQLHGQILELEREVLGQEHPFTLSSMNNLAEALRQQGKFSEAEQMHRQTLELRREVLGPQHFSTLASMMNIAILYHGCGRYEEAEQLHRQALELKEEVLGPDHPDTILSRNNLRLCLEDVEAHRTSCSDGPDVVHGGQEQDIPIRQRGCDG